ncbi:transcriptional coactivator p15/PC4 family protein [Bradyrhizobium sp. UFLA05-112]
MTEPATWKRARHANRNRRENDHLDIAFDPEFATHPEDPLAEPRVIFQLWKSRRRDACIRLTLSRYKGKPIADLRVFFVTSTGHMQASKKGIAFDIAKLPEVRKALEKAEALALELDLVEVAS